MLARSGTPRWLLLPAVLLFAALCLVASAPAQTLREQLDETQGKLDEVRASESALSASIAEQNRAIDAMLGEVSRLREEQRAAEAALAQKQAELERASTRLAAERERLAEVRARLQRALEVLRERLVAIYQAGSTDALAVALGRQPGARPLELGLLLRQRRLGRPLF